VTGHLIVLGSCGAWPEPGRACSGFVVESDGFRVVVDLGYGTLSRLLAYVGTTNAAGIDAVLVTHRHADHAADLHGLFRARWFGARRAGPIPLYSPAGVIEMLVSMEEDPEQSRSNLEQVFDWHPLPHSDYDVGPLRLRSFALPHWVPNAGIRLECEQFTVAFTGDCGPDPALAELGRDADLYVVEATDREFGDEQAQGTADRQPKFHLNAREAGQAAREARARRLLLTHFWPGNDREKSLAAAATVFHGPIALAEEGQIHRLP